MRIDWEMQIDGETRIVDAKWRMMPIVREMRMMRISGAKQMMMPIVREMRIVGGGAS